MTKRLTEEEVRERLRQEREDAGSREEYAERLGLSAPFIADVLKGRRNLTDNLLARLGLRKVVEYEQVEEGDSSVN